MTIHNEKPSTESRLNSSLTIKDFVYSTEPVLPPLFSSRTSSHLQSPVQTLRYLPFQPPSLTLDWANAGLSLIKLRKISLK